MPFCCGGVNGGGKPAKRSTVSKTRWSTTEMSLETYVEVDDTCDVVNLNNNRGAKTDSDGRNHQWAHDIINNRSRRLLHKEGPEEEPLPERSQTRKYIQESFWKEKDERRPSKLCSDRFRGPRDNAGDLARAIVSRVMELVDIVNGEEKDVSDHVWNGPLESETKGDHKTLIDWIMDMSVLQFTGFETKEDGIIGLSECAQNILADQETLVRVRAPVKIFGDIHGQLRDVLLFFNEFGRPTVGRNGDIEMVSYIFNGDWVDRGAHQVEVVVALFALKVAYPERIWLIRGNHEDAVQNKKQDSGFDTACDICFNKDGPRIFNAIHNAFNYLPVAATVEDRILVVHGGIGDGTWDYHDLKKIKRPLNHDALVKNPILYNILWSDPVAENSLGSEKATFGVHNSPRGHHGMLKRFGGDITYAFCQNNELGLLVRSHQCSSQGYGYTLMHKGYLMRVFSARHYDHKKENAAAMLLVGFKNLRGLTTKKRGLVVRAKVIRPPPLSRKKKSKSSTNLKKAQESNDNNDSEDDDGLKRVHSSFSVESECEEEEMETAVATKDQKQIVQKDYGVEVDEDCDVVNKSEGAGHTFHAQTWSSDEENCAQKLHTDAVVGRPALCGDRFKGPRDNVGQLAAAMVERVMELVDDVDKELDDVPDQLWQGPVESDGNIFTWMFSSERMKRITNAEHPYKSMLALCHSAKDIMLKQQPTALVELRAPVKVFGDLRGHMRDLVLFFDEFGRPNVGQGGDIEVATYVFNGGWVDSCAHQVELVLALFALKVTYPERVWLVRGSHEALPESTSPYKANFESSLNEIFGNAEHARQVTDEVFSVFNYLPLGVTVEQSVLIVHGGIGEGGWSLNKLKNTHLPLTTEDLIADPVLNNILWSQPMMEGDDPSHTLSQDMQWKSLKSIDSNDSKRDQESDVRWSSEQSEIFCKTNGLGLIVRSHQCVQHGFGYTLMHNGRVLRVFSARNYMGERMNAAAMLLIGYKRLLVRDDRGLVVRAKVISPPVATEASLGGKSASTRSLVNRRSRTRSTTSKGSRPYKPISMHDAEDTDGSPLLGKSRTRRSVNCFSCFSCFTAKRKMSKSSQ